MGGDASYTVDDALVSLGFGKFQMLLLAYAGMGWAAEAMEMMLLSFVGPAVQSEWGLTSSQESMISTAVFAGMLVGAYSWGVISDNYGRRTGFLATAMITGVAGCLSAFSPNYASLVSFRCLVGVGLGGGPTLSSWFLEFVPAPNRGTWMMVFSCFWTFGTVLEASLAWIVMPAFGWRWLLALSSLPSLVLLLFYVVVPESPRYLCMKGRTNDSLRILEKIAAINKKKLPSGTLVSSRASENDLEDCPSESLPLLSERKLDDEAIENIERKPDVLTSIYLLFSRSLIKTTLLIWVVFFGNSFSYYGLVLLTSELSNTKNSSISQRFYLIGSKHDSLYRDVFITSLSEFPGLLLAAVMVDRVGRRITMSAMLFMCCALLIPLLHHQSEALTTILLFGARMFIEGSFTIIYIYAPEVYPTIVRATGLGAASSMGRIGGILCPFVAVALLQSCHQFLSVIVFEIVIAFSGLAVLYLPKETKGRALNDTL
ncbi:Organic cation/carnitine transporter 7 [Nymphaea thermarum]|nr:Organic cation/carnitine transporter 7 [Nymphaea thermarum]